MASLEIYRISRPSVPALLISMAQGEKPVKDDLDYYFPSESFCILYITVNCANIIIDIVCDDVKGKCLEIYGENLFSSLIFPIFVICETDKHTDVYSAF